MFTIHTKPGCIFCVKAKELLTKLDKDYEEFVYQTEKEIADFKNQGFKTFPQIYENDKHIGGYDALTEYLDNDDF